MCEKQSHRHYRYKRHQPQHDSATGGQFFRDVKDFLQDRDGGQLVLSGLKDRFARMARVWADGAYAGQLVEWAKKTAEFVLDIVRKPKGQIGFSVLPWRWIVERTFAWLGN